MKKRFVYGFLAALAVCSCQVEEINETTPESTQEVIRDAKVFTAIIDDTTTPETRTSLDAEGNVLWKQGDQVSVFAGSTVNEQYQVTDASDGKTAASLNKVGDSGFVAGTEIDNNVAFYPYASTAAIAKSAGSYVISDITLPATQTYAEGSFGNGAFPMAAVTGSTGDMNLKFKNVLGGSKLQLKGTASIASISITGNNNEVLCGAAEVTVANGSTPSINLTDASAKTVTLDCGAGVALDSDVATPFIIALPPITMTGGFTVVVIDTENKQMEIKTTKPQTIGRSCLLKMPAVNYEGIASLSGPVPEAVDLGLSVKWASFNLGASSPEGYGDYYAWGETEPKENYSWSTYKFGTSSSGPFSKYNTSSSYGPVDYKTVLEPEDDVAHVILGGKWRMPTDAEWTELRTKCTWTWVTNYNGSGINGRLVTATNGNSIFLPAAGRRDGTGLDRAGSLGYFWSLSLNTDYPDRAWDVSFGTGNVLGDGDRRYRGHSVRPVYYEFIHVTSVSLSPSSLQLVSGESSQLTATVTPSNASSPEIKWSSSDTSVATVDDYGYVSAVAPGTATISAETYDGGFTASCTVTVNPTVPVPEAVDLGLSVKWASFNLGASKPEEYGDYYAWGETEPKDCYYWSNYKWGTSSTSLTKYNTNSSYGPVDNKTALDPEDDAVHVNLGGNWRMPTEAECTELQNNCTWIWTNNYNGTGVAGQIVTSNKAGYTDKSIFLPAAGNWIDNRLQQAGTNGNYWSLSLWYPEYAWCISFMSQSELSGLYVAGGYRDLGQSVRPVYVE